MFRLGLSSVWASPARASRKPQICTDVCNDCCIRAITRAQAARVQRLCRALICHSPHPGKEIHAPMGASTASFDDLNERLDVKCATARSNCALTKATPFRPRSASGFSSSSVSGPTSIAVSKQPSLRKVSQKRANSILAHYDAPLNLLKRLVARPRLELGTYGL